MTSDGKKLLETNGGTWSMLPVKLKGNFKITCDVLNDSFDGDFHFLLVDPETRGGIDVKNCPNGTDTPYNYIFSGKDFATYNQFFFPTPPDTLASAHADSFPISGWTHVIIIRRGDTITDDVGGQVIEANVKRLHLPRTLRLGLGGYVTTFAGGKGNLYFRNLVVSTLSKEDEDAARNSSNSDAEGEEAPAPEKPAPKPSPYD